MKNLRLVFVKWSIIVIYSNKNLLNKVFSFFVHSSKSLSNEEHIHKACVV